MSSCYLCSETRCLENAHILPRYLFKGTKGAKQGIPCVKLCPTHHRCFDQFQLTNKEYERLFPHICENLHYIKAYLEKFEEITKLNVELADGKEQKMVAKKYSLHKQRIARYLERLTWLDQPL